MKALDAPWRQLQWKCRTLSAPRLCWDLSEASTIEGRTLEAEAEGKPFDAAAGL